MGRRGDAFKPLVPFEMELIKGVSWLIELRWLASFGVILVPLAAAVVFNFHIGLTPFIVIGTAIFLYNILCYFYLKRLKSLNFRDLKTYGRFANLQIFVDWIFLILLAHYSGGIESPILFFFIFHVILATLLLSRAYCIAQAALASLLISGLAFLEYYAVIPHIHYQEFLPVSLHDHLTYISVTLTVLIGTIYVSMYLATTITGKIRKRDEILVRLKEDLEKAYQELEAADREKTEFMLKVTHELRAPLSAIQSLLKVIMEGYVSDPAKAQEYVERAEVRTRTLLELVKDLLNLAEGKGGARKDDFACVDVMSVLEKIKALYKSRLDEKRIEFIEEKPEKKIHLEVSVSDIELLYTNLIDNAVKYTPAGGKVTVSAGESENEICVVVKDTGIGIKQYDIDKIFEEFYRADNAKKADEVGTGLGLSIVKQIAGRYNAKISVNSEINKGSTFKITFSKKRG